MDYYEILGVGRDASAEQIKSAYRKMAFKYHPDRNSGDAAAEAKFKEINEAYSVLGDEAKRRDYDIFGAARKGAFNHGQRQNSQNYADPFEQWFREQARRAGSEYNWRQKNYKRQYESQDFYYNFGGGRKYTRSDAKRSLLRNALYLVGGIFFLRHTLWLWLFFPFAPLIFLGMAFKGLWGAIGALQVLIGGKE